MCIHIMHFFCPLSSTLLLYATQITLDVFQALHSPYKYIDTHNLMRTIKPHPLGVVQPVSPKCSINTSLWSWSISFFLPSLSTTMGLVPPQMRISEPRWAQPTRRRGEGLLPNGRNSVTCIVSMVIMWQNVLHRYCTIQLTTSNKNHIIWWAQYFRVKNEW